MRWVGNKLEVEQFRNRHRTLHAVVHRFATEERAREHFLKIRWPNGPKCPKCKKPDVRKVQSKCRRNRHLYRCLLCKRQSRGIPAKQLERLLGISYRTALSLIRSFRVAGPKRKRAFEIYIGYNDPAEFQKAQEAVKEERRRIKAEAEK